jgi:hypothetical protein
MEVMKKETEGIKTPNLDCGYFSVVEHLRNMSKGPGFDHSITHTKKF